MSIHSDDVMTSGRLAGDIDRYHTWPTITRQSNAHHSFNVLRIFGEIWGWTEVNCRVSEYIVYHDLGEMGPGDAPFPSKMNDNDFANSHERLENEQLSLIRNGRKTPKLNDQEKWRVKICDLIEMYQFATHERRLGNEYAEIIQIRVFAALKNKGNWVGDEFENIIKPYLERSVL